jgi:molybdate transport system substrate-binding protein
MLGKPVRLSCGDRVCASGRAMKTRRWLLPIAALALTATGCGSDDGGTTATTAAAGADPADSAPSATTAADGAAPSGSATGDLTIFADESLADAFTDIALAFESEYEDVVPQTNFDSSNLLADQIVDGTPADVFASADAADMDRLTEADMASSEPVVFATNVMTIIVPEGNPAGVTSVDDLGDPDLQLGLCVQEAPCGIDARRILDAAGVTATPTSDAETTEELVDLVENQTIDAAIVYATDMSFSGDAEIVQIRPDLNTPVEYSAAVVSTSANAETAQAFIDFLTSSAGQEVLEQYDFGLP